MIKEILEKLALKNDLTKEEMQSAVESIMTGKVDDNDIETFLIALNEKGVKEPEITAAAMVMKDKSLKFDIGDGTHIDTCGTGGTGLHTFNCSTASSFVAAAGGASITKHGNKAISSKSGSADFLTEAGADISHDREKLVKVFDQVGFIFLFAPLHHQSMKYVMPARQRIGEKTIFNLLGPHTNPCGAKRQIIGHLMPKKNSRSRIRGNSRIRICEFQANPKKTEGRVEFLSNSFYNFIPGAIRQEISQ